MKHLLLATFVGLILFYLWGTLKTRECSPNDALCTSNKYKSE